MKKERERKRDEEREKGVKKKNDKSNRETVQTNMHRTNGFRFDNLTMKRKATSEDVRKPLRK